VTPREEADEDVVKGDAGEREMTKRTKPAETRDKEEAGEVQVTETISRFVARPRSECRVGHWSQSEPG
jgi:hypothetical protein